MQTMVVGIGMQMTSKLSELQPDLLTLNKIYESRCKQVIELVYGDQEPFELQLREFNEVARMTGFPVSRIKSICDRFKRNGNKLKRNPNMDRTPYLTSAMKRIVTHPAYM
jgi:hypothetical protein